jgi:hypothetical protein
VSPGPADEASSKALEEVLDKHAKVLAAVSSSLYATRLCWYGRHGVGKLRGVLVALPLPPVICGARVDGIDYVPEVGMRRIQPQHDGWRDMTDAEVASADELLREITRGDDA